MNKAIASIMLFWIVSSLPCSIHAGTTGSGFTYQGELQDSGSPATGNWDFEFELFNADVGGVSVAGPLPQTLMLSDGVFTTQLDFGDAPFDGNALWLEVRTRPSGGGGFTTLTPRQQITAAPYALRAQSISASCPPGEAIRAVAPDGTPTCQPSAGDSFWTAVGDGRIESMAGVRIQPTPSAEFPFTIRHDSSILSSQAYLVETSPSDFARLSFYNDNTLERFWTIAARIDESGASSDAINIYNSGAGAGGGGADIMTIDGDRRVGINTTNPARALHVGGDGVRVNNMAHGQPGLRPVMVDQFGDLSSGVVQTRYLNLPASAFRPDDYQSEYFYTANSVYLLEPNYRSLIAPLLLPDGAQVKEITLWVTQKTTGGLVAELIEATVGVEEPTVTQIGSVSGIYLNIVTISAMFDFEADNSSKVWAIRIYGQPEWTGLQELHHAVIRYEITD